MGPAHVVLHALGQVVIRNRFWMTWNLILAFTPAVLAVLVFRSRGPRTPGWWAGAGLVLLFLPNAPYVVTDLVHLRDDVVLAGGDLAVVGGVLPVYGTFILAGFVAYAVAVTELGRYLSSVGLGRFRGAAELAVHGACAVGVVLGRVARLNSWEPVTQPHTTAERIVLTLTWRWAPVAVVVTFLATWVGYMVVRGAGRAGGRAVVAVVGHDALWRRFRAA